MIIYSIIVSIAFLCSVFFLAKNRSIQSNDKISADKFICYYNLLIRWVKLYQTGKSISDILNDNHIESVAIYGMKELGDLLYHELSKSNIVIKYMIDRDADYIFTDIDIYSPDDELEPVDAIIVTPVYYYSNISEKIKSKYSFPVISLYELIDVPMD